MLGWYKRIVKLEEQVNNIFRFGVIKEVDTSNNQVVVNFGDNLETPRLPYLVNSSGNATVYFVPKIGDQVIVMAKGGSLFQAVVLPSIYKQGQISGVEDEWRLEFAKGSIIYKAGKLEIKADTEIKLDATKVVLAGESAGGVVCQNNLCAFTGAMHPEGSTKVFGGK